jgi:hypothetical protein
LCLRGEIIAEMFAPYLEVIIHDVPSPILRPVT